MFQPVPARRAVEFRPATRFAKDRTPPIERVSVAFCDLIKAESESQTIGLFPARAVMNLPQVFTAREWQLIADNHFIHETGRACDVCPDFAKVLNIGLSTIREKAIAKLDAVLPDAQHLYCRCLVQDIDAIAACCDKHQIEVPLRPVKGFKEALLGMRMLMLCLSCEGAYGIALGRFDQYMLPYLDDDDATALLKNFFFSLAQDIDLEPGIHPGSAICLTLGRSDSNVLTALCIRAIDELNLPTLKYALRTEAADAHNIPLLIERGYAASDAANYVFSARNELIIPHAGADRFRVAAINKDDHDMENTIKLIAESLSPTYQLPAPLLSAMMDGCLEQGRDISEGLRYNNDYIHCAGLNIETGIANGRAGKLIIEGEGAPYASWFTQLLPTS